MSIFYMRFGYKPPWADDVATAGYGFVVSDNVKKLVVFPVLAIVTYEITLANPM